MDIFGIGPTELVFILLIALIVLGPKDMQKTGRTIGRWLRNMTTSDSWRAFRDTSREIRNLPNRLMREANLEDIQKDVGQIGKDVGKIGKEMEEAVDVKGFGTWGSPAATRPKPPLSKPAPAETPEDQAIKSESTPPPAKETNKEADQDA